MLKRLKELASDSLTYGLSTMLSQLLSLMLVPFYTRAMSPEDYGVLAMTALLLGFFSPIAGLGLDGALFRFYTMADDVARKRVYFSLATVMKSGAMLAGCLLLLPFYGLLNGLFFENLLTPLQFGLFIGSFLADNFSALTVVTLRSERKVKKIAVVNILTLLVSLILSIWLVLWEDLHVTGALLAGLIASLFRAVLYWKDSRRHFQWVPFDREAVQDLLGYGLPIIPHKIQAQVIHTFTAFMINHRFGIAVAGLYAVAGKLAKPLAFIVSIVQQSWVPYKFQIHKTDAAPARTFRQLISLYWLGLIAVWALLSLLNPWLYRWLIDPKYWEGMPYVPFIMAISVAQAVYYTVTTGFELSLRQKRIVLASFSGMVALVALSLLTVHFYPPYGLILSQAVAFLVMGAVLYPEARSVIRIAYPFFPALLFLVLSAVVVVLQPNNPTPIATLGGILVVGGLGWVFFRHLFPEYSFGILYNYGRRLLHRAK